MEREHDNHWLPAVLLVNITDDHCQLRSHANTPGFMLLQRNRPIRLQLAQPRREFCSRELRGTKPVRRRTSQANFAHSRKLLAVGNSLRNKSTYLLSLSVSRARRWSLVSVRVLSRLVSSAVHDYLSFLCSRWPYGRRGSGPLPPSLSLSLSLIVLKVCSLVTSQC